MASQSIRPAYRGAVWIDKETGRTLRIEMEAVDLPAAFPVDKAETPTTTSSCAWATAGSTCFRYTPRHSPASAAPAAARSTNRFPQLPQILRRSRDYVRRAPVGYPERNAIAIGTTDGISVCDHLARSLAFLVMEVEDGRVVSKSLRERFRDKCGNHAGFVELLAGSSAVICGGIGQGAFDSLKAAGSSRWSRRENTPREEAAALILPAGYPLRNARVCLCH